MKKTRYILSLLWVATAVCQAQPNTSPGWFRMTAQPRQPAPALPRLDSAPAQAATFNRQSPGPLGLSGEPSAPVAEAITPQIQALADGLQDNTGLIFDYVHDNIRFELYFGSKKGATLTLLEKSGNDFDQSALLMALLRASGHTNAGYQFGWMWIPYSVAGDYDVYHWWRLTLTNNNWSYASNYLTSLALYCGYPAAFATNNYLLIQRTWVVLTNGGTVYNLDPAFKVSEAVPGITLTSALGGTSTTISNGLWSAAGGTNAANYVSGLNEAALRETLTQYTTNVLYNIQTYFPNAGVQDLLGSWQIVPVTNSDYSSSSRFQTTDWYGTMPVLTWANEPTNLMSTLAITFAATNYQWYMPQLQGQRLALTYDGSGLAQLWQDDTPLAQHSTTSADTNVILSVTHPVGDWNFTDNTFIPNPTNGVNQVVTNSYQRTNATYALLYAFAPDWGWLQQRQNKLDAYLQQGLSNGSRQVLSESLNVMGLGWMFQTEGVEQMLAGQMGILPMYFHRLGRMAQESGKGYYVDVFMQMSGEFPSGGADAAHNQLADNYFDLTSFFASALEHGIIEQLQNTNLVGASTVKMLQIASTNGQAIYLANRGNWSSIQSGLSYDSSVLSQINTQFIIPGYSVLMPASGSNHVAAGAGSWAGYGFEARLVASGQVVDSRMIISGGYHGGYASDPTAVVNAPYVELSAQTQPAYYSTTPILTPAPAAADPVDVGNGTFQLESTDLALGQADPRGLSLTRYYNGTRRYSNAGGMTGGWVHNYCVNAATVPAPQAGLGGTTPAQAAPMIAATASAIAFYSGPMANPKNWTVTALIAKWAVDQLTKSGVSVVLGKDTLQFIQQPNGVYTPPANCTMTLAKANGAYSLQERHGNTFKFDSLGRLASIVDPYSTVSSAFTYNASNWVQTVTDWKNRSFTFNYSGTPQRLASVSDGTRAVSYGYSTSYNPQGDLVSVADPESKTNAYIYDANHQITGTLDALSRLVVSNVYDSQGRVITQYTQGDTNKTWHIYWSGWDNVTVDPAGGTRDYLYDDQSRLIATFDELLDETATWYDGQNHIIWSMTPMTDFTQYLYDGNHNLVQTIDVTLNHTNQFVYDSQFNLTRSIDPLGNPTTYGYNAQFSLNGITNGAGDWVRFDYNTDGTLKARGEPGGVTTYGYDQWGQLNRITYTNSLGGEGFLNNSLGDVLSHTNGRGFVTSFQYNSRRELTNTIAPTNVTVKVAYDACDNLQSVTDSKANTTTSFWSPTRHRTGTLFPATPQGVPASTNYYDSRDWLIQTVNNPLSSIRATTSFTNDLAGRLISTTDPVLRLTRFVYDSDGRKTATTNAALEVTRQQWDADSHMTLLTDPATHTVQYAFDAAGNQIFLTNRNTKRWQFQFDKANRLTNTITPKLYSTKLAFNNRGLLQSITKPSTQQATFGYDGKRRQTNRVDLVGTTTYRYDANDNLTNVFENGRTNSWALDAYDRLSSYRDGDGNLIQYRRDQNGNVTNLIYPGNRVVIYSYDSLNRLTNVTDWGSRQTTLTYDLANRLTSITRPNNTVRIISYSAAGETTNIVEATTTGFPIAFYQLQYNNAGRVQWEFGAPLPQANAPPARTMTYDDDNRLLNFNGQRVVHDNDGNMTSGPLTNNTLTTYVYDARNRLVSAGGLSYGYDPAGNRTAMTNGATATKFVVDPNAKLPQVLMRITGGTTNYYVYGLGLLYEVTETATNSSTLTYHYDCRGSTIAITDSSGNIKERFQYSSYGLLSFRSGATDTPFLYNGRYGVMTDRNGLLYMRARYYNPYTCRFINPDPVGFGGGLNWYCYADGNPISLVDPFGLSAVGDYSYDVGQVFAGYGLAVGGTVAGVYNAAAHPVNTVEGLYNVASHPVQAYNAISTSVANTWNSGLQGQGQIVGSVLIAAATVGAGEAVAGTRAAEIVAQESSFGAFAANTARMSQSEILSQWEIGSAALNTADYEALGGSGTSALFKAPYIQGWVDTAGNPLTSTLGQQLWSGTRLFFQGSGLTPNAYLGLGYGVPAAGFVGNNITGFSGSSSGSSTGK